MTGVLVMCNRGKEKLAIREALDVLNKYADELYPIETDQQNRDNDDEKEKEDLEASIAKELAEIKKPKKEKRRLASTTTGTACVGFIRTFAPIQPVHLVHYMLNDIHENKVKRTRHISRFLPVEKACYANIEDIEKAAQHIFEPHFNQKDAEGHVIPKKFAVACRVRNCTKLDRMNVTTVLASIVGRVGQASHTVDLQEPDLTIIAEVCQNTCMLSVVKDFNQFKKYNVESILGLNDAAANAAAAAAAAASKKTTTITTTTTKTDDSQRGENEEKSSDSNNKATAPNNESPADDMKREE
ncbi:thump domain-containing protein [Mycotypha africana]|uniref:thump domain-containing protein n=1 Tax=Mycotypha africana TaxID=64632 RepID=UPI002301E68B|nr:thump domain-containing protein [Mycotypha africana]KAI8973661.1 thump domain-containing protein [Mycotypha africana]